MKNNQTYKTDHPTIKEISIGDRFLLNDGESIVQFYSYYELLGFKMISITGNSLSKNNHWNFNKDLTFVRSDYSMHKYLDIKCKFITLKDKLNLL